MTLLLTGECRSCGCGPRETATLLRLRPRAPILCAECAVETCADPALRTEVARVRDMRRGVR